MIQGKGYRKIVSSAEMRRISEQQQREYERDLQVVLHGSEAQRRALRARNHGNPKLYWHPRM